MRAFNAALLINCHFQSHIVRHCQVIGPLESHFAYSTPTYVEDKPRNISLYYVEDKILTN